ncbi:MAG: hypothetical protein ACXWQO_14770, partial [Bdellovibrionota bacterium]
RGDTVRITFTREGQRMSLRSRYAGLNLTKSKRSPADPAGYTMFHGLIPGGGYVEAVVAVQSNLARGDASSSGVLGSITFESDDYDCKAGVGKLKVSRETREEFSPSERREPCKLTSYYGGMTFMPPRIVCDYGNGIIYMGGGRVL